MTSSGTHGSVASGIRPEGAGLIAAEPVAPARPPVADGVLRHLDPRHVLVQRAGWWIFWAAMSLAAFVACGILALVDGIPRWVALLAAMAGLAQSALLAWVAVAWPAREHRHARYRVDEVGMEVQRGVWWRHAIAVPRSRVQHIDVAQGPIERRFGLATLRLHTAGTQHSLVEVSGLTLETALAIRGHLLEGRGVDVV
jgi:membrane protein YdbS with pleckstrin-like domain